MNVKTNLIALAAGALLACLSAPAGATETFTQATSPGGIPFWYLQRADTPMNVLYAGFADGFALAHPDKIATPIVGSSLLRYGPAGRSSGDYSEALKDVEAHCGVSPSPMFTTFQVESEPGDFADALDLCFQMLTKPALRSADIEKIRQSAIAGRQRTMDNREALAALLLRRVTQADSPFGAWSEPASIAAVTPEDVDLWRREIFARANLTIVAVGAAAAGAFGPLVDKAFGQLPETGSPGPQTPPTPAFPAKTIVLEREGSQTAVVLEGPLDLAQGEGPVALIGGNALGGGLDRRLSKAVRGELGATYGISAGLGQITPRQRTFSIRSAMSNELAAAGLKRSREVYETWRTGGITEDEAASAREQLASGFEKNAETPSGKAFALLSLLRSGATAEYEANYSQILRSTDAGKVNALIRDKMPPKLTTAIVASKADGLDADCVIHDIEETAKCR